MSYILPLWSPPAEGEMWSVGKEVVCWPRSGWRGFGVHAAHIDSKTDVREGLGGWESDSAGTTALTFELEAKCLNCAPTICQALLLSSEQTDPCPLTNKQAKCVVCQIIKVLLRKTGTWRGRQELSSLSQHWPVNPSHGQRRPHWESRKWGAESQQGMEEKHHKK